MFLLLTCIDGPLKEDRKVLINFDYVTMIESIAKDRDYGDGRKTHLYIHNDQSGRYPVKESVEDILWQISERRGSQ